MMQIVTLLTLTVLLHESPLVSASQAAGTETLIGIVGPDYIIMGADSTTSSNIAVLGRNLDKIPILIDPFPHKGHEIRSTMKEEELQQQQQVVACAHAGEAADGDMLLNTLQSRVEQLEWEGGLGCDVEYVYRGEDELMSSSSSSSSSGGLLSTISSSRAGIDAGEVAFFARHIISSSLRTQGRLNTCLLIAGMVRTYETSRMAKLQTVGNSRRETNDQVGEIEGMPSSFSQRIQRQVEAASQLIASRSTEESTYLSDKSESQPTTETTASAVEKSRTKISLQPRLFWLDELGSLQSIHYGAHGFGSNFILSIMDQHYRPNLTREEAAKLIRSCFEQLRTRYVINCPEPPCIKCIDACGWYHM